MQDIIEKYLIPDLRKIVMAYHDDYNSKYECCIWEIKLRMLNNICYLPRYAKINLYNDSKRCYGRPWWTPTARDKLHDHIIVCVMELKKGIHKFSEVIKNTKEYHDMYRLWAIPHRRVKAD